MKHFSEIGLGLAVVYVVIAVFLRSIPCEGFCFFTATLNLIPFLPWIEFLPKEHLVSFFAAGAVNAIIIYFMGSLFGSVGRSMGESKSITDFLMK